MKISAFHGISLALLAASSVSSSSAAGIAAIKEQTFHADTSATILVYQNMIDDGLAPFVKFETAKGVFSIDRPRIAAVVDVPSSIPTKITEAWEVAPLRKSLENLSAFSRRFPKSSPALAAQITALSSNVSNFDNGQRRIDGKWLTSKEYSNLTDVDHKKDKRVEVAAVPEVTVPQSARPKEDAKPDVAEPDVAKISDDGSPEQVEGFRRAAEKDDLEAIHQLGKCYSFGNGVAKDEVEAVKWYRKAAERGYAKSQNNLGLAYVNGNGVTKDEVEAVKWIQKAADQGLAVAQYRLGNCYTKGQGVPKNEGEGVKWYLKAANQGDTGAQITLVMSYAAGNGVPQDTVQAYVWASIAVASGEPSVS